MVRKVLIITIILDKILSDFKLNSQECQIDQCEAFMGRVSHLLGTDNFANLVYIDLSGPVFCEDPTYVFPNEVAECKGK